MRRLAITALAGALSFAAMWLFLRGPWEGIENEGQGPSPAATPAGIVHSPQLSTVKPDVAEAEPDPKSAVEAPAPAPVVSERAERPEPIGPSIVRGTVSVLGAAPATGAPILFATDASGRTPVLSADADGRFLFADVAPGKFHLRAHLLGGQPKRASVIVEPGGVHTVDLEIDLCTLVRVRASDSSGTPWDEVISRALGESLPISAVATAEPPPAILNPPFAGSNNPYGIGSLWGAQQLRLERSTASDALGVLVVDQTPPFYASIIVGQAVIETKRVGPGVDHAAFTIDDAALQALKCSATLRVLDASTGEPLPARVSLRHRYRQEVQAEASADPDGWVQLRDLWPGPATLFIESEHRATVEHRIVLRPGEALPLGEFTLAAPISLSGTVEDPDGRPLAVDLLCELTGEPPRTWRSQSGQDGSFLFEDLPPGRFTIRIRGDDEGRVRYAARTLWTSPVHPLDARGASPKPLLITAHPPTQVAIDLTSLPPRTRLQILDPTGQIHRRHQVQADRDVWALKLPQGPMTLVIAPPGGGASETLPFAVAGKPVRLDPVR